MLRLLKVCMMKLRGDKDRECARIIQIYTADFLPVKSKPKITLFGEIYMHGKHNIMIDIKTIRNMFKDFAMTSSPHSLVDVEKYYNNKSEVFDSDSNSDSDISCSVKREENENYP